MTDISSKIHKDSRKKSKDMDDDLKNFGDRLMVNSQISQTSKNSMGVKKKKPFIKSARKKIKSIF